MKVLGWMHRKLMQNSIKPLKNFTIGNPCTCLSVQSLDGQQYYQEVQDPSYCSAHSRQPKICEISSTEHQDNTVEDVLEEESTMISELFHGFLTIGTLGSEAIMIEPTTPKFPMTFEKPCDKETDVAENELKLINDELEKFLEAEAKVVGSESSQRSSYASIITLGGKQNEDVDAEEHGNTVVCPLQGYLFGSSIELPEGDVDAEVKKEKTSLEELFKINNIANEHHSGKNDKDEKQVKGTYARHFMKKMLKKLQTSSRSCTASVSSDAADSVSTKSKLNKVLKMFHRKIHPEKSTAEKKLRKAEKHDVKNSSSDGGYHTGYATFQDNDKKRFSHAAMSKEELATYFLCHNRLSSSHSAGQREHWVKTDSNYLVLEL